MPRRDVLDDSHLPPDAVSRIWVDTGHNKAGIQALDDLMGKWRSSNHCFGIALLGPARCGKTTLMKEYLRRCRDGTAGRKPLKFAWVQLDGDTKPSNIAYLTLEEMGDPSPRTGDPAVRATKVAEAVERGGYDLIVYDEAQYLVDSQTERVQEKGVGWINGILNKACCPVVLIGYAIQMEAVLRRNPSLAGRLWPFPKFRVYDHAVPADLREFRYILREIEGKLGFPTPSDLWKGATAANICHTVQGRLGFLELYLEYARTLARRQNHSCLTSQILREAAEATGPTFSRAWPFNPFDEKDLAAAIERYK